MEAEGENQNHFLFSDALSIWWFCFFRDSSYFNVKLWFRDLRNIFPSILADLGRRKNVLCSAGEVLLHGVWPPYIFVLLKVQRNRSHSFLLWMDPESLTFFKGKRNFDPIWAVASYSTSFLQLYNASHLQRQKRRLSSVFSAKGISKMNVWFWVMFSVFWSLSVLNPLCTLIIKNVEIVLKMTK